MNIRTLRAFFGWCALINYGVLMIWFLLLVFAHGWLLDLSSKWLSLPVAQFDVIQYGCLAGFKLVNMLFFLVPFLGLSIIIRKQRE